VVDFRVDDGFGQHPKTVGISLEAVGVWTLAGCWCARYLTDGYIPTKVLHQLCGPRRRAIEELVDRRLLCPQAGGYQFVDWLDYQRSREQIESSQAANRERVAKWRARRWQTDPDV
jgi:hypothetical protein